MNLKPISKKAGSNRSLTGMVQVNTLQNNNSNNQKQKLVIIVSGFVLLCITLFLVSNTKSATTTIADDYQALNNALRATTSTTSTTTSTSTTTTSTTPITTTVATTSINSSNDGNNIIVYKTILNTKSHWAETIWEDLLKEGANINNEHNNLLAAMEVGMHSATQCKQIATAGLIAHCVEPSPTSFKRIQERVTTKLEKHISDKIHLYNVAASNQDGTIEFLSEGGTGDHVGGNSIDVWNMVSTVANTENNNSEKKEEKIESNTSNNPNLVTVPTARLENIIEKNVNNDDDNTNNNLFLLKIDTQGHEPAVMDGLTTVLQNHKVQNILIEFWPGGMNLMNLNDKKFGDCNLITERIIKPLHTAGYTLYSLPGSSHYKSPKQAKEYMKKVKFWPESANELCQYLFEIETKFPSNDYHMGYWTDILAVAPSSTTTYMKNPITNVGKLIYEHQQQQQIINNNSQQKQQATS